MCAELTPTGGKPASNMELLIYKVFKDLLVECETSNLAGGSQKYEYIWNRATKHTFQPSIPDLETAASFNLD